MTTSSAAPGTPPAPSARAVAAYHVAERWAEAVRAQSIYPAGHHRVHTGLAALLDAVAGARAVPPVDAPLRIVFADGGLLACDARFEVLPDGPLAWLRERLDHGALAGLEVLPDAGVDGFEAFGRRLLDVFGTKDPARDPVACFAGRWPGLRLLDRRFEGVFDGKVGDDARPQRTWGGLGPPITGLRRVRVAEALLDDPAIKARVAAIRRRIGVSRRPTEAGADDLLHRLAGVLPEAVAEDERRVRAVAGGLLDALEHSLEGSDPGEALVGFFEDPALAKRVAFLYSSIYRAQDPVARPAADGGPAGRAQGHHGDERVDDDLAAFLFEFERLPALAGGLPTAFESHAEELGVFLHMLAHHPEGDLLPGLRGGLRQLLARVGEPELQVVGRVLASLTQRADASDEDLGDRLARAVAEAGGLGLLRRCGYLNAERAVEAFPRDFVTYLDALDLMQATDRGELADVLARVAGERLAAAAPLLVHPEALLEPTRLARLLGEADPRLAPLADLLLRHGGAPARDAVVGWLRRLPDVAGETGLLAIVDDPRSLPDAFLRHLLDGLLGRRAGAGAEALVTSLLVQFVQTNAGRADRRARRIRALRLLAGSTLPEAEALLRRVAFARRWLVVPVEEKPVREAAREALARRGAA